MFDLNQKFCVLDYETFSECNLKKTNAFEYARHPSTEILCLSYATGTIPKFLKHDYKVFSWYPTTEWASLGLNLEVLGLKQLYDILMDESYIIVAHNSLFEQAVTRFVLIEYVQKIMKKVESLKLHPKRWLCSASLCNVYALPRALEGATAVLELPHQKDIEGHKLMMKWSKPKKPSKKDPSTRYTQNFDRLVQYCEHDIHAEIGILCSLPFMIPPERQLWVFDQIINFRGITIDRDLVEKFLELIAIEKKNLTVKLQKITNGQVQSGGQTQEIKKWLEANGCSLPDLTAKTVKDAIKDELADGDALEVLKIRQNLSKTSLKKYTAFLNYAITDSKVRFSLGFHAASTGRWNNTGVQLHNVPRGSLKYKDSEGKEHDLAPYAAELVKNGVDLETLRLMFGDVFEVFVSCIRTVMTASEGKELFVSDFAGIEARMLFWLANHYDGCQAFHEGRKMYEEMAMVIYNVTIMEQITKDQRFVGKQTLLGSGYGMGWKKFQKSCLDLGQEVSTEVAKRAIKSYRETHKAVPKLWRNLENAAIAAVLNPGKTYKINHTEWFVKDKFLQCRLPSGRCLYYFKPFIKKEPLPYKKTEMKNTLYHWGINSKTKKWEKQKTWGGTLTENVVQAISRDLLALAMIRVEKAGYPVILTVHDEIISERTIGEGNIEEFNKLMKQIPPWAKGAPIHTEGFVAKRYHK